MANKKVNKNKSNPVTGIVRGLQGLIAPASTNMPTKKKKQRKNRGSKNPRVAGLTYLGANFLRGALDPFSDISLNAIGVPDQYGGDTLKHWNNMEINVNPDPDGSISFVLIPSASTPLIAINGIYKNILVPKLTVSSVGPPVVPGRVPDGVVTMDFDAGTPGNSLSGIPWPTWAAYYGGQITMNDRTSFGPYDYKSQRIVSQGLEWRYTGTELDDMGTCTCAIIDAYTIPGYTDYTGTDGKVANTVRFLQRGDISEMIEMSQSSLSNIPGYRQQTMHSSEGSGGMTVMVSGEDGYALRSTNPDINIIAAAALTSEYPNSNYYLGTLGVATGGSLPVDQRTFPILPWQNLRPVGFVFNGLKTTASITLRVRQYVEATVNPSSTFAQFMSKSPAMDARALAMASDVQKLIPVMVPVTMNGLGQWWQKIRGILSTVGRIVGGMGIPIVSQVAGAVGGLADILG